MKPLAILRLGQTHDGIAAELGDFDQWVIDGLGRRNLAITVFDPRQGDELPAPQELAGVVMTGSHSMVTDREPWSERVAAWLRSAVAAAELPVLGICYGHQFLRGGHPGLRARGGAQHPAAGGGHPRGGLGAAALRAPGERRLTRVHTFSYPLAFKTLKTGCLPTPRGSRAAVCAFSGPAHPKA